ncbi:REP-associated tyrosine transposase [Haloferula sp.]|uniref:REP-associated tyrosine transposase n=1 Tax=Haloferula sp. TaxID=2497595 RepID=UPI003C74A8CE
MPRKLIDSWKSELAAPLESPDTILAQEARQDLLKRIARYEDKSYGDCLLSQPASARVLQTIIIEGHPEQYRLLSWCIMPNHVHIMIRLNHMPLAKVIQRWKGASAIRINKLNLRTGKLWAREYFDRVIRDETHYDRALAYINRNPVMAALCQAPEDWPFSSIGTGWNPDQPQGPDR